MSIQQLRKAAEWIRGRKKEQLLISVLLLGLFLVIMMPVKETDEMKETQKEALDRVLHRQKKKPLRSRWRGSWWKRCPRWKAWER